MTTNEKIGVKLRQLRERRNWSLQDVAIRLKKSRKSVHAYEMGIVSISVDNLEALLRIYGVKSCSNVFDKFMQFSSNEVSYKSDNKDLFRLTRKTVQRMSYRCGYRCKLSTFHFAL